MMHQSPDNRGGQTSPVQRVFGLEIQNVSGRPTAQYKATSSENLSPYETSSKNSSGKKSSATGSDHSSASEIDTNQNIVNAQYSPTIKDAVKHANKTTDEVKPRKSILRNVR